MTNYVKRESIVDVSEKDIAYIFNNEAVIRNKIVGVPRASSIDKACMRMHVLLAKNKHFVPKEKITSGSNLVFAWGDAFHHSAQNTDAVIKRQYRMGWWRCTSCNTILGFGRSPEKQYRCRKCNARREAIIYHEHSMVVNDPFYLTGHPDMFVMLEDGVLTVTEFKSITGHGFKKLDKPQADHIMQVHSYLMGLPNDVSELKLPSKFRINTEFAIIAYVSKEALAPDVNPKKYFKVRRNNVFEQMIKDKLLSFKKGYENYPDDMPPMEPLCAAGALQNPSAKSCLAYRFCQNYYLEHKR